MKNTIKIIILIVAIVAAIVGVLFFIKYAVKPSEVIKRTNQYSDDVKECLASLKNAPYPSKEDSIFKASLNRIEIFNQEDRIDNDDADKYYKGILDVYCPKFLNRCFNKFSQSVWYKAEHNEMSKTISELESIKLSDGSTALKYQTKDSLDLVLRIISNYNKALQVSQQTTFRGINSADAAINDAKQYMNDPYLSNCTELYNALNNVKPSIANSHYNYLVNEVDRLKNYVSSSEETFKYHADLATDKIHEYENHAKKMYGYQKDIENLKDKIYVYWNENRRYWSEDRTFIY